MLRFLSVIIAAILLFWLARWKFPKPFVWFRRVRSKATRWVIRVQIRFPRLFWIILVPVAVLFVIWLLFFAH